MSDDAKDQRTSDDPIRELAIAWLHRFADEILTEHAYQELAAILEASPRAHNQEDEDDQDVDGDGADGEADGHVPRSPGGGVRGEGRLVGEAARRQARAAPERRHDQRRDVSLVSRMGDPASLDGRVTSARGDRSSDAKTTDAETVGRILGALICAATLRPGERMIADGLPDHAATDALRSLLARIAELEDAQSRESDSNGGPLVRISPKLARAYVALADAAREVAEAKYTETDLRAKETSK